MNILITGSTGFVGSHLIDYILEKEKEHEIHCTKRRRSKLDNVEHVLDEVMWHELDITDSHSTIKCVEDSEPDYIFHLAAQSFVPSSWNHPIETLEVNAGGTINLLEGMRKYAPSARLHFAGTSEEYGLVRESELPIDENNPLRPMSPYGVSKVCADMFIKQYHSSYDLGVVITRAFNHSGNRRGPEFVCSEFAKKIVEEEKGLREELTVGNLSASRDFTDVRDIVRAYWLAMTRGRSGERYNIGSGKGIKIRDILETLVELSDSDIEWRQSNSKFRPSDVNRLECDYTKFHKETCWRPEISFSKTLEDLLDYWRQRV